MKRILILVYSAIAIYITYVCATNVPVKHIPAHEEVVVKDCSARVGNEIVRVDAATYDTTYIGNMYDRFHFVGKGVIIGYSDSCLIFQKNTKEWMIANNLINK